MKIAVAIDGSEHAFRAAKYALTLLGNRQDAELEVISVTDYNKVEDEQLSRCCEGIRIKKLLTICRRKMLSN
ncbi:hypothetical protein CSV72_06555 [Sporosarcina sp. P20a]|uniref:universal stress protein n=1 Tax=Sporosarcina sp. P20a TaxID=2048256 RepID=UPI000C16B000|nr:universal stress protein [Sporosarcina sp. P20a]PIC86760.1 hypothetical protein CSV72_06555 [Sporosarcina sp. P20a]